MHLFYLSKWDNKFCEKVVTKRDNPSWLLTDYGRTSVVSHLPCHSNGFFMVSCSEVMYQSLARLLLEYLRFISDQ